MFPQSASTMRQAEISPLPPAPSDHPLPCLPATFRLAFRPSKGHSPTKGCSALGKIMVADDAVGWLVEKSVLSRGCQSSMARAFPMPPHQEAMPAGLW